jgi:hypothetical protein
MNSCFLYKNMSEVVEPLFGSGSSRLGFHTKGQNLTGQVIVDEACALGEVLLDGDNHCRA